MAYCDNDDLVAAGIEAATIIQLTDDEGTAADASATTITAAIVANAAVGTRIAAAIAAADALIASMVQKQFDPDFSTVPAIIKTLSVDLSLWYLHKRRRSAMGVPDAIRETYEDAMKILKEINRGFVDLGVQPAPAASDQVVSDSDSEDQVFTVDSLEDF